MKYCLTSVLLLVLLLSGTASAETVTVTTPQELQTALDYAAENPGTTIYLSAGTYNVDHNKMYVPSDTTVTGDSTAIVKLIEHSYTDPTPSVTRAIFQARGESAHDITFHGFTIDGNEVHKKIVSHSNDHLNLIQLYGSSDVQVYDMTLKNGLGDGVKIRDGSNAKIHDNTIDRIGHDAIWTTRVTDVEIYNNYICCRVNSGVRIVDGNNIKVYDNEITSKNQGGAGIEIQKAKNTQMNMEVSGNKIYHTRDAGIWAYGYQQATSESSNIVIHDNEITDCGLHRGGGVTIHGMNAVLENNKITENNGYDVRIKYIDINIITADRDIDKPRGDGYKITLKNNDIGSEVLNELSGTHTLVYSTDQTASKQTVDTNIITVGKCDGKHDHEQINDAIKQAESGDTVDLGSRTYIIDGTIWIKPGIALRGDGAVVRIDPDSSRWFREGVPVIGCKGTPHDIELGGFTVDGNCGAFSSSWANDGAGKSHNCMKLIILAGSSGDFGENIYIHDMKFINAFSDAVYVRYANNVRCEDNFISNCQHEGIYYSVVTNGLISKNKIAGITSDCARLDNCQTCLVEYNTFFSYGGDSNGAAKHGENGLQIGDAGSSNGYNAVKTGYQTKDITVRYNTFSDPGLKAIWLHEGTENVYIDDTNKFINADELETDGIPVDISYEHPPTQEQSEEVFDSIFDILNTEISETGNIEQGNIDAVNPKWQTKGVASAYIYLAGYDGEITIEDVHYIPVSPSKCANVLTNTKNLANKPVSQKSTVKLSDGINNTLKVELTVKTKYKVKDYKTVSVLGKSVKVPYYKVKSKTSVFTQSFEAPVQFPAVDAPKAYVTHYNGSHAIVEVANVPGIVKTEISIPGSSAREYRLIGEVGTAQNGFKSAHFENVNTWKYEGSQVHRSQSGLYIDEPFYIDNLSIKVTTPYKTMEVTDIEYAVIEDESSKFLNLGFLTLLVLCLTYGRAIIKIVKMIVGKWY